MSRTLQFKRYANTVVANTTGASGELIIDTTNKTITVHDGTTAGGNRIATEIYVAQQSNTKVNKSGDTMTGNLTFSRGGAILGNSGQNEIVITSNVIDDWSGFAAYGYGAAQIYANTFVQLIANTGVGGAEIWNFNTDGSITFPDNTVQRTSANVTPAFNQANTANVLARSAFDRGNTANVLAQSAFNTANTASSNTIYLQGGLNTANSNTAYIQGALNTANTNINAAAQTIPQNAQTTNYTLVNSDAGKHLYYTQSTNVNLNIPWSSNASFANGTTIMIVSRTTSSANVTVTPNTGVTMYLAGNTTSASRNVITYGVATLLQVASNTWMIYGTGVT